MIFDSDFEIVLANTEESKRLHYSLRYQVYCQEKQLEDSEQFANKLEKDPLDNTSAHFIARSKKTKEWIGAIRVIVSDLRYLPTYNLLPDSSLHRYRISRDRKNSETGFACEISRLCILNRYRKSRDQFSCPGTDNDAGNPPAIRSIKNKKRQQSDIMLGLLRAAYIYCLNNKIDICLFTITKPLARILKSFGLKFIQVGTETDYHGIRIPYCIHPLNFLGTLHVKSPEVYNMFVRAPAYRLYDSSVPEFIPSVLVK